jgi:hypothetical protein
MIWFPQKEIPMQYVGVDLHKKLLVAAIVNQDREFMGTRRFACSDPDGIRAFFKSLGEFLVVVEATASYEWFIQIVEPVNHSARRRRWRWANRGSGGR